MRVLEPMEIGDIFDEAFSLYKKNFVTFFGIAAIVYIPIEILAYVLQYSSFTGSGLSEMTLVLSLLTTLLLVLISVNVTNAALTKAIADRHTGKTASIGTAYGNIVKRAIPLFITVIMVAVMVAIGFVLLVIPAIILTFMAVFVSQVFVVEDKRYFSAFSRSRELAKDNWMRIFIIAIVAAIINAIVTFGSEAIGFMITSSPVLLGVITGLASAFILPIISAAYVLLYFDVRVRKEGYDLELLAKEMASPGYQQ